MTVGPWKKRSIFFELPYWEHNPLPNNLDVMHIEKNIVDAVIGALLDSFGKTKDHAKALYDLKEPRRSKWSKAKNPRKNFSKWFEIRGLQDDVPDLIKEFSRGPNIVAKRYSGYLINGYRFHIRQCDARQKKQNSGVTLVASTISISSSKDKNPVHADLTYYGRIVDILEFDYYGHFKFKGSSIPDDNGEVVLIRNDVPKTIIDVEAEGFLAEHLEVEHNNESEDESEDVFEEKYEEEFADEFGEETEDDVDLEDEP
ncbi:hypothetical protein FXO37_29056 [Capsicum annuum]|nr:hypothetical protein FXO37_29056 [Capsicum annuum]